MQVYYQDLSQAEIAALDGIQEELVKTRLRHARAKVERCLRSVLQRERAPGQTRPGDAR